jgi:outer membrane receptor for ferrienterochelin and colicins
MVLCLKFDTVQATPGKAECGVRNRSRPPICRSIWICFFGLALAPCFAVAQESDVRDLTNLTLEDLAKARLFTASRHLDDPRKAPAAVTVIDRDEIARYGWRTLADLLASVPGIYTAYDRTYSYVGVRGYLESGDYNARVLLLVDGHRLNENIYDSALIGTEFPLDLSLVDHVEIVRGPGSALYGTNAELAVINVITRQPDSRPTVEAASLGESFLGREGELSTSFRAGGTSVLLSGSLYRSNGQPRLFFPEYASPETNYGFADNLDGDRYDHVFGVLRRGRLRIEGLFGKRDKIVPSASYATNFNDPANRSIDSRGYVDASYSHDFSAETQLDVRAYYDAYRFWGSYPYGGTNSPQRTVQINDASADWIGIESILGHRLGRHRIVAGATGEYNLRVNQRNYYLHQPPFLDDNRKLTLAAIFGEAEINPVSKFSLNLGGRIDWYSSFGHAISPRVAAMFLPSSRTSFKYIFNRAFRAPDPYDESYVDNLQPEVSRRSLLPERIQSHSLILDHDFSPRFHATAVGFQNNLLRVISENVDPVSGGTTFANGQGDDGHGLEFEFAAKSASAWSGRASYSLLRTAREETHQRVANSPSDLAKLNATTPASRYGLLAMELLYTGPQPNYSGQRIPASFITNATVSTRFKRSDWSISASCYNLFDHSWSTPTGPEVLAPATAQDGRTWRIRIAYRKSLESRQTMP